MPTVDFNRPLLAIDTSTTYLSLALQHQGRRFRYHQEVGSRQSELILPQIGLLLAEAGLQAAQLGAIVYAQGPGAFTGLRIGVGVAQGLAAPFATPLIGIPCLDAVAAQTAGRCVLAATDARMGEIFYAWFDTENGKRLSDYRAGAAQAVSLPPECKDAAAQGIGNAYHLPAPPPFPGQPTMPTAETYLQLALSQRYPAAEAAQAELLYVRDKIALTAQEQAARKAAPSS